MREPSLRPERSASANSATSACYSEKYSTRIDLFVKPHSLVIAHKSYQPLRHGDTEDFKDDFSVPLWRDLINHQTLSNWRVPVLHGVS